MTTMMQSTSFHKNIMKKLMLEFEFKCNCSWTRICRKYNVYHAVDETLFSINVYNIQTCLAYIGALYLYLYVRI